MTEQQQIDEAVKHLEDAPVPIEDKRPFWVRLLESIRFSAKPGATIANPIEEVKITGGTDF